MDPENRSLPTSREFCTTYVTPASFELDGLPTIQMTICVLAAPMCLTTTLANLLVIISVWRTPSLHSPSNALLVGLALSDLGVGLLTYPATIISNVAKIIQDAFLFCDAKQVAWVSGACLCTVSLLTLSAISMDRYAAIHYHLRYEAIVTVKRVLWVLLAIWVTGCSGSLFYGIELSGFFTTIAHVLLFSSLAIIVWASCSIQRVVRRHRRQILSQVTVQSEHKENSSSLNLPRFKRSFKNTQILCCTFLLFYLPLTVTTVVIFVTGLTPSKQSVSELSTLLLCFNSTLNPFIFCWRYRPIRASLVKLLRDLWRKPSATQ